VSSTFSLQHIRSHATKIFLCVIWAHVPLTAGVALLARNPWRDPAMVAAVFAIIASLAVWRLRDGIALRSIVAVCLTFGPILFVYAGRGHFSGIAGDGDWQIDYHMYFFGVFAMLAAYVDWRVIAVSAVLTAGHHLIFDLVVPTAVFPEEGLDRVALHALCVVIECGVLFWMTTAINKLCKQLQEIVDITAAETADALSRELATVASLERELSVYRGAVEA
jgi:methyl-accepting chemotaxis protein